MQLKTGSLSMAFWQLVAERKSNVYTCTSLDDTVISMQNVCFESCEVSHGVSLHQHLHLPWMEPTNALVSSREEQLWAAKPLLQMLFGPYIQTAPVVSHCSRKQTFPAIRDSLSIQMSSIPNATLPPYNSKLHEHFALWWTWACLFYKGEWIRFYICFPSNPTDDSIQ